MVRAAAGARRKTVTLSRRRERGLAVAALRLCRARLSSGTRKGLSRGRARGAALGLGARAGGEPHGVAALGSPEVAERGRRGGVCAPPAATQKDAAERAADLCLRDSLVQMITSWQRTLSYKLGRQIYPSVRAPVPLERLGVSAARSPAGWLGLRAQAEWKSSWIALRHNPGSNERIPPPPREAARPRAASLFDQL